MSRETTLARIEEVAVVPVVRVSKRQHALCAAEGIVRGALGVIEITLTVPGACDIIGYLASTYGDRLLIGAGTVLDTQSCRRAIDAGAQFIVGPVFDPAVVEMTRAAECVAIPGALTPTEILEAWRSGADLVKIFPCGALGGPAYIRALRGPFPDIRFIVTGGVRLENAAEFLKAGASAVGAGETILPQAALDLDDFATVALHARQYADVVSSFRRGAA